MYIHLGTVAFIKSPITSFKKLNIFLELVPIKLSVAALNSSFFHSAIANARRPPAAAIAAKAGKADTRRPANPPASKDPNIPPPFPIPLPLRSLVIETIDAFKSLAISKVLTNESLTNFKFFLRIFSVFFDPKKFV